MLMAGVCEMGCAFQTVTMHLVEESRGVASIATAITVPWLPASCAGDDCISMLRRCCGLFIARVAAGREARLGVFMRTLRLNQEGW